MRSARAVTVLWLLFSLSPAGISPQSAGAAHPTDSSKKGAAAQVERSNEQMTPAPVIRAPMRLNAEDCVRIAMENSQKRAISKLAVEIAKYQHNQALSGHWPSLSLNSAFTRLDEDPTFVFPKETSNYTIEGMAPAPITAKVTVPDKRVTLMDRESVFSSLDLTLPIYTGGMVTAAAKQAKQGIEAAKEAARRTDLELVYDVKRIYYGAVLARNLLQIGNDTLSRLQATLELTERLYQNASASVTKMDYLRNKVIVDMAMSTVAMLEGNEAVAKAALINTMGLPWETQVDLSETELPSYSHQGDLERLVADAYEFSPDWKQIEAGLKAAESGVDREWAGHFPKVGLSGRLWRWDNSYDAGMATDDNKNGWAVGVGVQIPLFSGFLTHNKIKEARANVEKLKDQKVLLREGIALQIKHAFLRIIQSGKQQAAMGEATQHARENRELNIRAYQDGLAQTKDVIESQILEAVVSGQNQSALYTSAEAQFHMDFLIGEEVRKMVMPEPAEGAKPEK